MRNIDRRGHKQKRWHHFGLMVHSTCRLGIGIGIGLTGRVGNAKLVLHIESTRRRTRKT